MYEQPNQHKTSRIVNTLITAAVIAIVAFILWWLYQSFFSTQPKTNTNSTNQTAGITMSDKDFTAKLESAVRDLGYEDKYVKLNTANWATTPQQGSILISGSVTSGSITANSFEGGSFSGNGSNLTNLNAGNLSSGIISTNLLPGSGSITCPSGVGNLAGGGNQATLGGAACGAISIITNPTFSQVTATTIGTSNLNTTNIATNNLNTITLASNSISSTNINSTNLSSANLTTTNLNAQTIATNNLNTNAITATSATINGNATVTGSLTANTVTATSLAGDGLALTNLNADNITSGTLAVSQGGTGANSFILNGVLFGNGTGSLQATASTGPNQCLVTLTAGGTPTWGSCSAGGGITGSGTNNTIAMFNSSGTITDSLLTQDAGATTVTTNGGLQVNGNANITGTMVGASTIQGASLISTIATGTAPLQVTSTTKVANLNADLLDGYTASDFAQASSLGNYVLKAGDTMGGNLNMGTNKLIGGTGITDVLKLQGTTGNGTSSSPAIQLLTGNNGATTALTVLNNGKVGIGTASPDSIFTLDGPSNVISNDYGTFTIRNNSDTNRHLSMGIDTSFGTWGSAYIKAVRTGSAAMPLLLQPSGGVVGITTGTDTIGARFQVNTGAAGTIGQIIKGASSQTANLQEWQNSSGVAQVSVGATGKISTLYGLDISRVAAPASISVALINSVGNVNAGTHYYHVTYVTALGETNARVSSAITTDAANGQVTVTIPTSSDSRVIARKIYRTKAGETSYSSNSGLLATINDNVTTTYVDNTADASLTGVGAYWRENTTSKYITMDGSSALFTGVTSLFAGTNAGATTIAGTNNGGYNVGLGTSSLQNLTSGVQNVGIGFGTMTLLTSGSDNVAIGYGPNGSLTTGSYNIAIGRNSLFYNQTGGANTAVGFGALTGATGNSNSNNTAIGYGALNAMTTGTNNIGLGMYSGYFSTNQNNELFINSIYRNNRAGDVANSIIYGVQSSTPANQILALGGGGKVGVNATAPGAMLQITSNAAATIGQIIKGAAAQTADLLQIQNSSSQNMLSISATGQATFQNSVNSSAAFSIKNVANNNIFNVDTANGKVFVGEGATGVGSSTLVVKSATDTYGITNTNGVTTLSTWLDSGSIKAQFGTISNDALGLYTNNQSPSFVLYQDGSALFKNSTNSTTAFAVQNSTGDSVLSVDTTNNRVGIANTSPSYLLHVGSSAVTTGTSVAQFENAGGTCTITPSTAGGISCTSDERLKKDITTLDTTSTLDKLLGISTISYHMHNDTNDSPLKVGFSAQQLETILPDLVVTNADGYKSVSYAGLTPYLVAGLQAQQSQIDKLAQNLNTNTKNNQTLQTTATIKALANQDLSIANLNVSGTTNLTNLTVANVTITNTLTVQNLITTNLTINGHIITAGNTPTITPLPSAGQGATATIEGNDTSGTISIVITADSLANGAILNVKFANQYSGVPRPVISPTDANGWDVQPYIKANSSDMTVYFKQAPQIGQTYTFNYFNAQ